MMIRRRFLHNCNLLIAWFLSLFGVACSPFTAEYGTPEASFHTTGVVHSADENIPIDHIRVIMGADTAYSNSTGTYKVEVRDFPTSQSFNLNFTDVDGPENGNFEPKDTLIEFNNPEFHDGNGHWFAGETEKVVNAGLRRK